VARDGAIRRIRSAEVARMCNADLCGVGLYRAVWWRIDRQVDWRFDYQNQFDEGSM